MRASSDGGVSSATGVLRGAKPEVFGVRPVARQTKGKAGTGIGKARGGIWAGRLVFEEGEGQHTFVVRRGARHRL